MSTYFVANTPCHLNAYLFRCPHTKVLQCLYLLRCQHAKVPQRLPTPIPTYQGTSASTYFDAHILRTSASTYVDANMPRYRSVYLLRCPHTKIRQCLYLLRCQHAKVPQRLPTPMPTYQGTSASTYFDAHIPKYFNVYTYFDASMPRYMYLSGYLL